MNHSHINSVNSCVFIQNRIQINLSDDWEIHHSFVNCIQLTPLLYFKLSFHEKNNMSPQINFYLNLCCVEINLKRWKFIFYFCFHLILHYCLDFLRISMNISKIIITFLTAFRETFQLSQHICLLIKFWYFWLIPQGFQNDQSK